MYRKEYVYIKERENEYIEREDVTYKDVCVCGGRGIYLREEP